MPSVASIHLQKIMLITVGIRAYKRDRNNTNTHFAGCRRPICAPYEDRTERARASSRDRPHASHVGDYSESALRVGLVTGLILSACARPQHPLMVDRETLALFNA